MNRALYAAIFVGAVFGPALAGSPFSVSLDEARVVSFPKPVTTIYVGNPMIADVTIIDNRHAFVQGKAFGATNVIALDQNGRQVVNQQIVVAGKGTSTVTLQRGTKRSTLVCGGGACQPTPMPGDGRDSFDEASSQAERHQNLAGHAATRQD
ncbi:hypothetical protein FHS83_001208 [Rhizomicrobium palustre]|uniref:Pilus formation protein N-terminal domain-containing protein n=1 Tax=Rhizomicrobium palustre TaxID=189966 RepID=A0A846MY01_9PROT|nr:pilus assembly protein N-terminal domain-containing protein [Rhizomicrobium palustre]NIK87890.1 hypothetical protein [Rhizomicrobium palustre]